MKAYLDNNVVCAIANVDTPAESGALDRLLISYEEKKAGLVTSEVTLDEIKRCRDRGSVAALTSRTLLPQPRPLPRVR